MDKLNGLRVLGYKVTENEVALQEYIECKISLERLAEKLGVNYHTLATVVKPTPMSVGGILSFYSEPKARPKIICLCGSTRFVDTFNEYSKKFTLEGKIVVSIELVLPQNTREDPQHSDYKVKQMLDELHLRKIDLADEVFVINVNGYVGESTSREIAYALKLGKPVKYLEVVK